ncbi:MAG: hypothetical protein RBU30_08910 [Polyangia bacterium]|jgi:hypothetical protein|nr:hypothetical protein [Polyangia bacterium]
MAYVADTYTAGEEMASLRSYCGSAADEDIFLTLWFAAAMSAADSYMGHDWTDDDGEDIAHPPEIRLGLYEYVRAYRLHHVSDARPGVQSVRTGNLSESYFQGSTCSRVALEAAAGLWRPWAKDLLLRGAL